MFVNSIIKGKVLYKQIFLRKPQVKEVVKQHIQVTRLRPQIYKLQNDWNIQAPALRCWAGIVQVKSPNYTNILKRRRKKLNQVVYINIKKMNNANTKPEKSDIFFYFRHRNRKIYNEANELTENSGALTKPGFTIESRTMTLWVVTTVFPTRHYPVLRR